MQEETKSAVEMALGRRCEGKRRVSGVGSWCIGPAEAVDEEADTLVVDAVIGNGLLPTDDARKRGRDASVRTVRC